ncbi:MAG: FliB family protein [Lachnospiraceae bacterium]|nr:FliB family protein [Lachnospiraceae bacterium]
MIISKPDYYNEFKCLADKCEDTCCAGWQIVIDDKSLEAYQKVEGDFGERLRDSIDWEEGTFHQKEERRCAFLNDCNLCDLYTALGEESLCTTCTNYPRHIEEFENIREYTLSVSCPEAARILLGKKEPVQFIEEEVPGEEEWDDFDFLLHSQLVEAREVMLEILQNRERSIELRTYLISEMGRELQEYVDEDQLFFIDELFEKYRSEEVMQELQEKLDGLHRYENTKEIYDASLKSFVKLYQLEQLHDHWETHLEETEAILYRAGSGPYWELKQEFAAWMRKNLPDYEIWLEQLLVYFIQTYFCGAVYDGYIGSKVRMAVVSVHMIYEMLMARWERNEHFLDMEEVIQVVYEYSRELEHSDWNLEKLEELLDE